MEQSRRERKVITVLFADLVGFTSRAEQLDPEDVEAILRPYHERLRYELERWGGTVEKFIGDAVVALFGAPVAGEDDPERAVRAALAIRDWIAEEEQAAGAHRRQHRRGAGATSPRARRRAREWRRATSSTRRRGCSRRRRRTASSSARRRIARRRSAIDYREHAPVEAKGKEEPVPVWEVVQARARFGVDLAPETRTPLVGREREVELLVGTLARARQQRSPELVTLVGVPGIGKSRLVGELFQSIERGGVLTYWRQGRSLPYGEGVSYWALAEMVKAQAGILETDSDEEVGGEARARGRAADRATTRSGCCRICVRSSGRRASRRARRRRRSPRGAASSRRSRRSTRSCSCSRTSSGRTTGCSTSSSTSSTGCATSRC